VEILKNMSNLDKNSKKILVGSLIGGLLGIGAITIYCASKKCHKSPIKKISNTISHIVDALEEGKDTAHCAMKNVEEKLKDSECLITDFFELASVGMDLWKKIKQGK